jgi:nucleotide-binding universal stress UspA family protein
VHLSKILVPVDFSAESKSAICYASAFAEEFGASLTLLHVVKPMVCTADFGYGPVTRYSPNKDSLRKARTRLNLLSRRMFVSSLKPSTLLRTGTAETEIINAACGLKTDLIVMGTRGNSTGSQDSIESTAHEVVRRAPCPVFIVHKRENDFVSCA